MKTKAKTTHIAMMSRCYGSGNIRQPTYKGCTVIAEWHDFSNFKQWFDENYIEGFHLDKDILVEGNKIYSPDTCRFIPQYLNNLLNTHANARGAYPTGISAQLPNTVNQKKNITFRASVNNGYGKQISKTFKTVEDASAWYSKTKKQIVKAQAQRAFLENAIKTDIYLALVRREF